jgi:hypothetical protein
MNTEDAVRLLHAKRAGRGKWIARCPAHGDHHPSLSIKKGDRGVLLYCQSNHCSLESICEALGIKVYELFYGSGISPILEKQRKLERLERRLGLFLWLEVLERDRRAYYAACVRNTEKQIVELRDELYPEKALQRRREEEFLVALNKYGWDGLWEMVLPEFEDHVREPSR